MQNKMTAGVPVDHNAAAEPIRLWLVDDSNNFRTLLAELLGDEPDLQCTRQFSSAEEILDALGNETPPDAVLLDVRMPGMGGLEAIRPIKSLAPGTRVLMLTTFYDSQARDQALRDGASALLLKNFRVEEIAEHVRRACDRRTETEGSLPAAFADPAVNDVSLDSISGWPHRRAPEEGTGWLGNHDQKKTHPNTGHRNRSWRCASSRLVRGVSYLRSLLGLNQYRTESLD